jgi:hypothetical protein
VSSSERLGVGNRRIQKRYEYGKDYKGTIWNLKGKENDDEHSAPHSLVMFNRDGMRQPSVEQTRGIVISNHQKVIRK